MLRERPRFYFFAAVYVVLVVIAALITGPTIIRGADGLETTSLLILGLPSSPLLMIAGGLAMLPFGYTADNVGSLVGLLVSCIANVVVAYRWRPSTRRPVDGDLRYDR